MRALRTRRMIVWLGAAALAACAALAGCTPVNLRGNNFQDLSKWGEAPPSKAPSAEVFGFSEQARQVERNLGVQ